MTLSTPSTDDRPIWDIWLAANWLPAMMAADELGIFPFLNERATTPKEAAERLGLSERGLDILFSLLAGLDLLVPYHGRYHLGETARNFLLPDSPWYWGWVFPMERARDGRYAQLMEALKPSPAADALEGRPVEAWESGELDMEQARTVARFMHSHSLPAAMGAANRLDLSDVSALLDVGGGSGCFASAFATRHPDLRATVMELPAMCRVAEEYIAEAGVADRVDTMAVDMFREDWPEGFDALFFSNVFHDWSFETCEELAAKAYAALPRGGCVMLHEQLLGDDKGGPTTVAAFSLLMLSSTKGQQFTFEELSGLLRQAGFDDIGVTPTYGYYSVITGYKR